MHFLHFRSRRRAVHRRASRSVAAFLGAVFLIAPALACAQAPYLTLRIGDKVPDALSQQLRSASLRDLGKAPAPDVNNLIPVPDAKPGQGKPLVLYVGAEFCPYCAAVRWPLVMALMRFGRFTGLEVSRSSSSDAYPNTATFSFVHAKYTSQWIDLQTVEVSDRDQHPLQKPTHEQLARFRRFDKAPYTHYPGSIPFLDLGDRWIQVGSPVPPDLYKGLGWYDVASQIDSGKGALWAAVLGEADRLTRKLCIMTNGQPAKVCSALPGKS